MKQKKKQKCPICGGGANIVRDHYTNMGFVCFKGHKFSVCNACKGAVKGLKVSTHCELCGAIYELERSKSAIPGMKFNNPLGKMHKEAFHERFKKGEKQ